MVRNFKFFHGIVGARTRRLTAMWTPTEIDAVDELSRTLSNEIAREIDEEILNNLLEEVDNQFITRNVDVDYLRRYLEIGGNRA
jgi:hypothetical protein